jgi:hypothetical protein
MLGYVIKQKQHEIKFIHPRLKAIQSTLVLCSIHSHKVNPIPSKPIKSSSKVLLLLSLNSFIGMPESEAI